MNNETFDFSEALRRMKEGKKVKRKYEFDIYTIHDGKIKIGADGMPIERWDNLYFLFGNQDILATDWEEVEG